MCDVCMDQCRCFSGAFNFKFTASIAYEWDPLHKNGIGIANIYIMGSVQITFMARYMRFMSFQIISYVISL